MGFLDDFEIAPDKSGPTGPTVQLAPNQFPQKGTPAFLTDFEVAPEEGPYRGPNLGPLQRAAPGVMENAAGGFGRGVMDVVNTGAQGIGHLTNHITQFLADRGIGGYSKADADKEKDRLETLNKRIDKENKDYESKYGGSYVASGGRIGGNLLASAPALAVGGEIPAATVAGLARIAPAVSRLAPYATNPFVRYGLVGPVEGGIGGASVAGTTSAANPESVGQQIKEGGLTGALLGPAGPIVYDAAKYAGGAIGGLIKPFYERGQQKIATNAVSDLAGNPTSAVAAHEIIPGSTPTLAEATADPGIATLQRQARDLNPTPFVQREEANNAARLAHLNRAMGTSQDVDAAKAALDQQASHAVQTLFQPGQAADSAPVVSEIDSILNGPSGKRDAVKQVLTTLRSKLVNKDGSLESNPEVLYNSVRKQIGDMLDKSPANSPAGNQAKRELMQVRDVLDERITKAVPGFDHYLADYSQASKPIEAMKYLQSLNLTDSKGNITLAKVDNALKGIQKQRQAGGINAAKSLDQSHIDALTDLREDLLRAQNTQLGISKGSPTAQNLATQSMIAGLLPGPSKAIAPFLTKWGDPRALGAGLGTYFGNLVGGPVATTAGLGAGSVLGQMVHSAMSAQNAKVMSKVEEMLLNPHSFNPSPVQRGQNLPLQGLISRLVGAGAVSSPAVYKSP